MTIVQYWRPLQIHLYSTHLRKWRLMWSHALMELLYATLVRHWRPTWGQRQTFPYSTSLGDASVRSLDYDCYLPDCYRDPCQPRGLRGSGNSSSSSSNKNNNNNNIKQKTTSPRRHEMTRSTSVRLPSLSNAVGLAIERFRKPV